MNPFKKYPQLSLLSLALVVAAVFLAVGLAPATAAVLVVGTQLTLLALSPQAGACFTVPALTAEQVKEWDDIMKELKPHGDLLKQLKDLAGVEGGFAAIKALPALMKTEQGRNDTLQGEIKKLRKQAEVFRGTTGVRWVGAQPFVTDDCARALTSIFVLEVAKLGDEALRHLNREQRSHEGLLARACEHLGIELKTALTTTQIPVPTIYVPQITELVFAYGAARQYATVYPLGSGIVKLPRLAAGEDDFSYLGVGTAGMSQAVAEKRATAELVTFTPSKAGGLIRIPTELEEDTFIPMGQFLARYIARQFAKLEDATLFVGDGTSTYANILGVGPYCAANTDYLLQLAATKTKPSDATLADFRALRGKVSAAVLANMAANGQTNAAYYLHPSWEAHLVSFNTLGAPLVYKPQSGGQPATLDGFPIHWIGVSQAYATTAAPATYCAFFGDLTYWYLGERGQIRVEVSKEVFFATDELAMRALERIDVQAMAVDAVAALQTAAA